MHVLRFFLSKLLLFSALVSCVFSVLYRDDVIYKVTTLKESIIALLYAQGWVPVTRPLTRERNLAVLLSHPTWPALVASELPVTVPLLSSDLPPAGGSAAGAGYPQDSDALDARSPQKDFRSRAVPALSLADEGMGTGGMMLGGGAPAQMPLGGRSADFTSSQKDNYKLNILQTLSPKQDPEDTGMRPVLLPPKGDAQANRETSQGSITYAETHEGHRSAQPAENRPERQAPHDQLSVALHVSWVTARRLFWEQNPAIAEQAYQILIREYPDEPDLPGELGNIYWNYGRWQEAAALYHEAGLRAMRVSNSRQVGAVIRILQYLDPDRAELLWQNVMGRHARH
ncbi:hypothetical protein RIEGSTA812A_PEG_1095 [invertebrate metagenome]|uniref:Tetratricopeptide repeat protein n=1 Tax=invertebrate metagenome TaxID=1711999 RepID=A0A484HCS9_9ZZZZ